MNGIQDCQKLESAQDVSLLIGIERKKAQREHYAANRERMLAAVKKYQASHKEALREREKIRWANNKSKRKNKVNQWRAENKDKVVAQQRRWKSEHKDAKKKYDKKYKESHPEQKRAHEIFAYAKRMGLIIKTPCSVCQSQESEAHHNDYSKPLEVEWLCHFHHMSIKHKKSEVVNGSNTVPSQNSSRQSGL